MNKYLFLSFILNIFYSAKEKIIISTLSKIIRIGSKNFSYIHLSYSSMSQDMILDSSASPGTNERKFYGLSYSQGYYFLNQSKYTPYHSLLINTNNKRYIGKFGGESSFIRNNYIEYLLSISNNDGNLELYDFKNNKTYYTKTEKFFGYKDISEIGSISELSILTQFKYHYTFSFIINNSTGTYFVSKMYVFNSSFFSENLENGYDIIGMQSHLSSKSKMVSCFALNIYQKIICFYRNNECNLIIAIYNILLEKDRFIILDSTGNNIEDDDIFYKGILFDGTICIFIYYKYFIGSNPILSMKEYYFANTSMINYKNFGKVEIEANGFNRNYMLNDIIKIENNNILFASSSEDREKLYLVVLNIFDQTEINIKYYKINIFESHNHKFYKTIKLSMFKNFPVLGFNHCLQKYCEEDSSHYSSLIMINYIEDNYNKDLIDILYDSNNNVENGIKIDFNIYQNNIFGNKVSSVEINYIADNLILLNPIDNSIIQKNVQYNFTLFFIKLKLILQGEYSIYLTLYLDNSKLENKKERLRYLYEIKPITYNLQINNNISNNCDDLCTLCNNDNNKECITCRYGYFFILKEKFCETEDGKIAKDQINDVYESLKKSLEEQKSQIIPKDNAIFQLSTVDEQKNSNISWMSSIDLGDCELLLKKQENLDDDNELMMIKLDLKNEDSTYVQFELYNPNNLKKVDLEICRTTHISINLPVKMDNNTEFLYSSLEKSGYNLFDLNDSFYKDVCSTYTASNGADMTLSDRKSFIYDKNKYKTFCQKDCYFVSYNTKTKKAKCNCDVINNKIITNLIKIDFSRQELAEGFFTALRNSNFLIMKCYKLTFSLRGQKNNIGSYFILTNIILIISLTIFFIVKDQKQLSKIIYGLIEKKELKRNDEKENSQKKKKKIREKIKERCKTRTFSKKGINFPIKRKITKKSNTSKSKYGFQAMNIFNSVEFMNQSKNGLFQNGKSQSNKNIKNINNNENVEKGENEEKESITKYRKNKKSSSFHASRKLSKFSKNNKINKDNTTMIEESKDLNDREMNWLDYDKAIHIDKRSYFQYYWSLIKKRQLILSIFWPKNDYNLISLKCILFVTTSTMTLAINGFFFNDSTMNKIFINDGEYNFIYQLPSIIYSTLISTVISIILRTLSLSEKYIIDLKKEKNFKEFEIRAIKTKKCLCKQFVIFLVMSFLLMAFFWYFISCFCSVYKNTQIILIKDTFTTFICTMLYPFGLCLIPGLLRIPALRAMNRDRQMLYEISKYIALL